MKDTIEVQKQLGQETSLKEVFLGEGRGTPMAGFWRRAVAYFLDMLLLYLFAQLWFPALKGFFLGNSLLLPIFHGLLVVFYFAALDGPLGKGRTIGKHVMGLMTRGVGGQPLTWGRAAGRAVVKNVPLVGVIFESPIYRLSSPGTSELNYRLTAVCLIFAPAIALFICNAALVAIRRDKRGFHETLTGSCSFKVDWGVHALKYLAALPRDVRRRDWQISIVLLVVMIVAFEVMMAHSMMDTRQYAKYIDQMWEDNGVEGYHLAPYVLRPIAPAANDAATTATVEDAVSSTAALASSSTAVADVATTPAVAGPPHYYYTIEYRRIGAIDDEELLETIRACNLTTGVARWTQRQWDEDLVPQYLIDMRREVKRRGVKIDGLEVRFTEYLQIPWFPGMVHFRSAYSRTFPFDIHLERAQINGEDADAEAGVSE